MSKGNPYWNLSRGKVGSLVMSINKGQVVTRQYQPNVANPRSNAQMLHRARFASCVNFYKRATANFFKFAFEDKRPIESDYSAFMRHNTSALVAPLTREQIKGTYPAIAPHGCLVRVVSQPPLSSMYAQICPILHCPPSAIQLPPWVISRPR